MYKLFPFNTPSTEEWAFVRSNVHPNDVPFHAVFRVEHIKSCIASDAATTDMIEKPRVLADCHFYYNNQYDTTN